MAESNQNPKETYLDYDGENDIIYVYQKGKFKGNVEIGGFVLDLDKDKKIIGVEILNASEVLGNVGITKDMLAETSGAKLKIVYKKDSILIGLVFTLPKQVERPALIAIPAID